MFRPSGECEQILIQLPQKSGQIFFNPISHFNFFCISGEEKTQFCSPSLISSTDKSFSCGQLLPLDQMFIVVLKRNHRTNSEIFLLNLYSLLAGKTVSKSSTLIYLLLQYFLLGPLPPVKELKYVVLLLLSHVRSKKVNDFLKGPIQETSLLAQRRLNQSER